MTENRKLQNWVISEFHDLLERSEGCGSPEILKF